jgi:hypothetical protein
LFAFHGHFRRAELVVLNMAAPQGFSPAFTAIDANNPDQARRIRIARSIGDAAAKGQQVQMQLSVNRDVGSRLMAKLALGLGRELLGQEFLETEYGKSLRRALWERDPAERRKLPIRGTGYLSQIGQNRNLDFLCWPNGWTITVWHMSEGLCIIIGTPSGNIMTVLVSNQADLLIRLGGRFAEGEVFVTLPVLGCALNHAVTLPELIAHRTGVAILPELASLEARRRDPKLLPLCRP